VKASPGKVRGTRAVLQDHLCLRRRDDLEADLERNYDKDVVLLTGFGVFRGKAGVRRAAALLHRQLPCAEYEYRARLVEGEVAFLEWAARCPDARVDDGADSFLIRGGRIVVQTIHYTVTRRARAVGRRQ
jgi:hypothetical protein